MGLGGDWMLVLIAMLSVSIAFLVALFCITDCFDNDWALPIWLFIAWLVYFSIAPALNIWFAMTMIGTFCCAKWGLRPVWITAAATLGVIVGHMFHLNAAISHVTEIQKQRRDFPAISLTQRLQNETASSQPQSGTGQSRLAPQCETNLTDFETYMADESFIEAPLKYVHEQDEWEVGLNEYHSSWMIGCRHSALYWLKYSLAPEEKIAILRPEDAGFISPAIMKNGPPDSADLVEAHTHCRDDFLNPNRMGWFINRDRVFGFFPHQFSRLPDRLEKHPWQISRLELVSLLKHDEPLVYVSHHLPDMEHLADAPTRPLNAFESSALEKLRTEQDVVIRDGGNKIRMVGSLRAATSCLKCHSVQRGELLGAFSYDISRLKQVSEPPPLEAS